MAGKARDIITRIVTRFDRASAEQAEGQARKSFGNVEKAANRIGAALASAFAVGAVIAFGKASIQAAIDSEAVWNRVSGAVERTGTSWTGVERRVRAAADALRDLTGIDDDKFAEGFDALLATTGNVNLSLSQMGFAADVAARFFGGDLAQAAETLGRIFQGNTRAFRSFGIVTTDVNEGLRILRERSAGAAENELKSLGGQLEAMRTQAGDVSKAFGFLALRLAGGSDSIEVSANRARLGLQTLESLLNRFKGFRMVNGMLMPTFNAPTKAGEAPPNDLAKDERIFITGGGGGGDDDKSKPPEMIGSGARQTAQAIIARAREEREAALKAAKQTLARANEQTDALAGGINLLAGFGAGGMTGGGELSAAEQAALDARVEAQTEHWQNITGVATNAAYGVAHAWQDTFDLLLTGTATIGGAFETLGRGIVGALAGAVAEYASLEMKKNIAAGIGMLAASLGFPFSGVDPARGTMSAKQHFAAAGLWGVLAGAAGSAQKSASGGLSGGVPSGAADIGGRMAERAQVAGPEIHLHINPWDANNPLMQDSTGRAVRLYNERYGT